MAAMTLEDKKRLSDIVVSWIGVLGLLAAASWTLVEYYENKDKEQSQQTLKYVTAINSGELFEAQSLIATTWATKSSNLEELIEAGNENKLADFIVSTSNEENVRSSIWIVIDFYESLATCVNEEICSKDNALAFFGERSLRFYNLHHHFIEATRQELGDEKYAALLQGFVSVYYESK
jgi:hypothetical protein